MRYCTISGKKKHDIPKECHVSSLKIILQAQHLNERDDQLSLFRRAGCRQAGYLLQIIVLFEQLRVNYPGGRGAHASDQPNQGAGARILIP